MCNIKIQQHKKEENIAFKENGITPPFSKLSVHGQIICFSYYKRLNIKTEFLCYG